jgi:hypothetical protein
MIPLILILVIAVFAAGKLGLVNFSGIPVLDSLFPAQLIRIAIVGQDNPQMDNLISSAPFQSAGVVYSGSLDQSVISEGVLNNYNVVILYGEPACSLTARRAIADYVKGGGKLIVLQNACTLVPGDPSAYGWNAGVAALGDVMPVTAGLVGNQPAQWTNSSVTGTLKIANQNSPIFNGVFNFTFTSTVTPVTPTGNSEIDAYTILPTTGTTPSPILYTIVESNGFTSGLVLGKVLYFAYDPSILSQQNVGSNLFLNAVLYMASAKG